jgi:hypothetical protein
MSHILTFNSILSLKHTPDFIQQRRLQLEYYLKFTIQTIIAYEKNIRKLNWNPYSTTLSFYDYLLYFLDVEGSPFSHLIYFRIMIPHADLGTYRSPKETERRMKRKLKYEIQHEQLKLHILEQQNDLDQHEYEHSFNKIESLKEELNHYRLSGDEFISEQKGKPYIFSVSQFSRIYIYPYTLETFSKRDSMSIEFNEELQFRDTDIQRNTRKFCCNIDQVKIVEKGANTYKENGFEQLRIEFKDGTSFEFYAAEPSELISVLGAHVKQMNLNRMKLVNDMKQILKLKEERYSSDNEDHELRLMYLWQLANNDTGEKLKSRKSEQWVTIGFQGSDPATDFRAMGILGLELLIYFLTHYPATASKIIRSNREYPFSVAGINLGHQLLNELGLSRDDTPLDRNNFAQWDNKFFNFMCRQYLHTKSKPFEEMFCLTCELLDKIWVEMNGDYMKFGEIMKETQKRLRTKIEQEPVNFNHLRISLELPPC